MLTGPHLHVWLTSTTIVTQGNDKIFVHEQFQIEILQQKIHQGVQYADELKYGNCSTKAIAEIGKPMIVSVLLQPVGITLVLRYYDYANDTIDTLYEEQMFKYMPLGYLPRGYMKKKTIIDIKPSHMIT